MVGPCDGRGAVGRRGGEVEPGRRHDPGPAWFRADEPAQARDDDIIGGGALVARLRCVSTGLPATRPGGGAGTAATTSAWRWLAPSRPRPPWPRCCGGGAVPDRGR